MTRPNEPNVIIPGRPPSNSEFRENAVTYPIAKVPLALALLITAPPAFAQVPTPEQRLLREIYQELLEINTTDSTGDTTKAAQAMAARLERAGFAEGDIRIVVPPGGRPDPRLLRLSFAGVGARSAARLDAGGRSGLGRGAIRAVCAQ
jgi:hypothetical protein